LEWLEPRTLLSVAAWNGGGGDLNWNNPLNWSTDQLPGPTDDVTINVAGNVTIEVASDVAIHSVQTSDAITVSSGTFSISGDSQINAQFTNAGGTVSISGATVTGIGQFVNAAGGTLSTNNSTLSAVSNNGTWEVRANVYVNGALTTGALSAIHILEGTDITALDSTLTVAAGFTNHGEIDLSAGGY